MLANARGSSPLQKSPHFSTSIDVSMDVYATILAIILWTALSDFGAREFVDRAANGKYTLKKTLGQFHDLSVSFEWIVDVFLSLVSLIPYAVGN